MFTEPVAATGSTRCGRPWSPNPRTAFAQILRAFMRERSLTQETLAADLHVTQPVVSRLTRGVQLPTARLLTAFVNRYDLDAAQWFAVAGLPLNGHRKPPAKPLAYDAAVYAVECGRRLQKMYGDLPELHLVPLLPPDTSIATVHAMMRQAETEIRRRCRLPASGGLFSTD